MRPLVIAYIVLPFASVFGQTVNTGLVNDNYFSSNSVTYNPSSIVDSKSKMGITSNVNLNQASNFFARDYSMYGNFDGKLIDGKRKGYQNSDMNFDIFNFKYEINHQNAFAYTFRNRVYLNQKGIPNVWNENAALNYAENTINTSNDITGMSLSQLNFTEHVFTYARTIFDKKESLLKAGASIKLLNGLNGNYFYANGGSVSFQFPDAQVATLTNVDAEFGQNFTSNQLHYKNRGLGFDIGATYEIRPYYEKQYYDMDGEKNIVRYNMNKYTWKFSASITDIGSIKFMKDTNSYNFTNPSTQIQASKLYNTDPDFYGFFDSPFDYINTSIQSPVNGAVKSSEQKEKYRMSLPTTLHGNVDYNFKRNIYISYNFSMPLIGAWDKTKVSNIFIHTITPRVETERYSILLPLSQTGTGKFYFGTAGRFNYKVFSFFAGSNNMAFLFGKKSSLTRNFFAGVTVNLLYKVPSDVDFDKVSDAKDECPYDPGLLDLQGCPDTDGDGIPDKEDYCIYDQGPKSTKGCPDTDGDGIIDMNDMCPTQKGLGVHYGCPDTDFDGVIDAADKCPDVPGIELNNGCPFENPGCCMDDDGDGVSNKVDKCPDHAGSVYNDGCPIDQGNINKIDLKDQKAKLDPNHTAEQIKVLNNNDTIRNFITTKADMNKLMSTKTVLKEHAIYFDTDQASITAEENKSFNAFVNSIKNEKEIVLMVIGNTDRDGSLDYNLILSKKRAEAVKRKLIDAGIDEEKITLYYYGEAKALQKETYTAEQKRMDRRVDIKIIKAEPIPEKSKKK